MRRRVVAALFVVLLGVLCTPFAALAADGVDMYRMYNQWSGEHLYTADASERDALKDVGWRYEGVGWTAPTSGSTVYRLYNPYAPQGDHHYTMSKTEYDQLVRLGWKGEGAAWHSAPKTGTPLYRLYNPYTLSCTHHYTTSTEERDQLVRLGWRFEGIAWYGVTAGSDSTQGPSDDGQDSDGRMLTMTFITQSVDQSNFTVNVRQGEVMEEPADPVRKGFTFKYWGYPDTNEPFDFSKPIEFGTMLYAFWEPYYAETAYDYEVYYLDGLDDTWYQGGFAGGSQRTVFIKTDNPTANFTLGTECDNDLVYTGITTSGIRPAYYNDTTVMGSTYVWSGYFSDVADQGVADGDVPMLKVPGGYVMQVGIKDELPLGKHDLYVYESSSHSLALNATRVGSITVADGAAAEARWADDLVATCTKPGMTPPQKMAAINGYLLDNYQYWTMTNQSEFSGSYAFFAATPNTPFYVTHRWNSYISPMALEYLANRIGGFESVHNCYGDYYPGTPEWQMNHAFVECAYQGEIYRYMACPQAEPTEPPLIDFSNTDAAPFDKIAK